MNENVQAARTQQVVEHLRKLLDGSQTALRTEAGKSSHSLLAVALNGFARHGARKQLTELEQKLVDTAKAVGYSDADLAALGETYTAAPASGRSAVFTDRFAQLNTETGYGLAELRADMPQIAPDTLNSPNARFRDAGRYLHLSKRDLAAMQRTLAESQLDAEQLEAMRRTLAELDAEKLREYNRSSERVPEGEPEPGWGVICYGAPMRARTSDPAQTTGFGHTYVRATYLECIEGTEEAGNDEVFYGFATTDDHTGRTYRSPELSMDAGDERDFPPNTLWDGSVRGGGLCIDIEACEADHSDLWQRLGPALMEIINFLMDMLIPGNWGDMVIMLIEQATGTGIPAWAVAIAINIVAFIANILRNQDDYLGSFQALIPNDVFEHWKRRKEIVTTYTNVSEAVPRLLALDGLADTPTNRMLYTMFVRLGAFHEGGVSVDMNKHRENHGHYVMSIRLRLP